MNENPAYNHYENSPVLHQGASNLNRHLDAQSSEAKIVQVNTVYSSMQAMQQQKKHITELKLQESGVQTSTPEVSDYNFTKSQFLISDHTLNIIGQTMPTDVSTQGKLEQTFTSESSTHQSSNILVSKLKTI